MTRDEQLVYTKTLCEEDSELTDVVCSTYLALAEEKILVRLYPHSNIPEDATVPRQYHMTQCELAARLFLKRGAEGEKSHSENGVNRSYESIGEEDILARVTPFARVVR